jgi:UDP-glucose 4-epimerase
MNILVTGGAGFIGSHVTEAFLAAGHRPVIVDNLHTGHRSNLPKGVKFYKVDIRNAARLEKVISEEAIDVISHQAALANVRGSMENPQEYAEVNVIGTLNLLEAARKHGVKKIVFASTGGAVYGEGKDSGNLPFTEQTWPRPKDNYGANKLSMEFHLDLYHANYGLRHVILRYPNVYGPRQDSKGEAGVVAIFTGAMVAGQPTKITGDGKQTRDFTYVGDVAHANLLAAESDALGIFNVGTGIPTDINTIHAILSKHTNYTLKPEYIPRPSSEVLSTYLDSSKAKAMLGWEAQIGLDEGLRRVVEWMK